MHSGPHNKKIALSFIFCFIAVLVFNSVTAIFSSEFTGHLVASYAGLLSGFVLLLLPVFLFRPGLNSNRYLFLVLAIFSYIIVGLHEPGTMSFLLAVITTNYGMRTDILPKSYIARLLWSFLFLFLLLLSFYIAALRLSHLNPAQAVVNEVIGYTSGVLVLGYMVGFGQERVTKLAFNLTEQELEYLRLVSSTNFTQVQIAESLQVSKSRVQKIGKSLRLKTNMPTDCMLVKWACDQGLV